MDVSRVSLRRYSIVISKGATRETPLPTEGVVFRPQTQKKVCGALAVAS